MEIKGIKSLKGRYILQKTKSRKNIVQELENLEQEKAKMEEYSITEEDIKSLAKMQSADRIKKAIDGLGKFLEEPELEMQR